MKLDDIKKLQQKKYRAEFGHFLVEGEHLLLELQKAAVHNPALLASQLYVTAAYEHWQSPFKTQVISDRQMAQIADTQTPQGILAVCGIPHATIDDILASTGPVVLLDEVSDPGNAGTIIRTADAVGAAGVVITTGGVDPYNGKCVRATAGSVFHLPVVTGLAAIEAVAAMHREGVTVVAATGDASADLLEWAPHAPGRLCWAFGSEAHGVGEQVRGLADVAVRIPMPGRAESLNVASAAAVCLYADLARSHGRIG